MAEYKTRVDALISLKNLLEENNIEYWITCGTLLGAHRDKDIIKWDKDIDLAIDAKDKWKVIDIIKNDKDFFFYKIWRREMAVIKNDVKIDIFCTEKVGYSRYYYSYRKNSFTGKWDTEQIQVLNDCHFFPLQKIDFLGEKFYAPKDIEGYLKEAYGDWKTPNPDWGINTINWHKDHRQIAIVLPYYKNCEGTINSIQETYPEDWYRLYVAKIGKISSNEKKFLNKLIKKGHKVYEFSNNNNINSVRHYLRTISPEGHTLHICENHIFSKDTKIDALIDVLNTSKNVISAVGISNRKPKINSTEKESLAGRTLTSRKYIELPGLSDDTDFYMTKKGSYINPPQCVIVPEVIVQCTEKISIPKKNNCKNKIKQLGSKSSQVGAIIINFLRPETTIKCIESLREVDPNINIYVGDQDNDGTELKQVCKELNANYIDLPFDCGLGIARNTLVKRIIADGLDYIYWGDNDFIFTEGLNIDHAVTVLEENPEIGTVGGSLIEHDKVQHYERFIYHDPERQIIVFVPLEYTYCEPKECKGIKYYDCDMTFNFSIAKKDLFTDKVKWHENIKVKHEHSVKGDTPILCRQKDDIFIKCIEDIFPPSMKGKCSNKYSIRNLEIWTEFGWEEVEYAFQHYVENKPMRKLLTSNGYVDLTHDHSLVIKGNEVTPNVLNIGDSIEQHRFPDLSNKISVNENWAWFLGFFLAEGYAGKNKQKKVEITNQNKKDLDKCIKAMNEFGFNPNYWNVKERKDKCMFLNINCESFHYDLFRSFYDKNDRKIIPSFVYQWDRKSREHFLQGFLDGDGSCSNDYKYRISQKSDVTVHGLLYLMQDIFPYYTLDKLKNKHGEWYSLVIFKWDENNIQRNKLLKPKNIIKKIEDYTYTGYVYDLGIKNKHHSFLGGIGNINLHNSYFYIQLKEHSDYKVAYVPSFRAIHKKVRTDEYNKFRNRNSDEEEYKETLNLKTGYTVGKGGWDYTKIKPLNINQIQRDNPIMQDEDVSIEIDTNNFVTVLGHVLYILNKENYNPILIKETCLNHIRGTQIGNNVFINIDKLDGIEKLLLENKFTKISNNQYNKKKTTINFRTEKFNNTKPCGQIEGVPVSVPLPVVNYLQKLYGLGDLWKEYGLDKQDK